MIIRPCINEYWIADCLQVLLNFINRFVFKVELG